MHANTGAEIPQRSSPGAACSPYPFTCAARTTTPHNVTITLSSPRVNVALPAYHTIVGAAPITISLSGFHPYQAIQVELTLRQPVLLTQRASKAGGAHPHMAIFSVKGPARTAPIATSRLLFKRIIGLRSDRSGRVIERIRIGYTPSARVQVILTVAVHIQGKVATQSFHVTVQPPRRQVHHTVAPRGRRHR